MPPLKLTSISPLIDRYDLFIVDLWGVIHDGVSLYPGVIETLKEMHKKNKKVIFLSNAPKRATLAKATLSSLGIENHLYLDVVTSGEVIYQALLTNNQSLLPGNHHTYYYIGPERDKSLLEELAIKHTIHPKEADFAITTGFNGDDSTANEKHTDLLKILEAGIPLICANPDLVVVRHSGEHVLCAGIIAKTYEHMGGKCFYIGKPHKAVYQACFALAKQQNTSTIAAIGDNLDTDIKGAAALGLDSYLIPGGIHSHYLQINHGELPADNLLESLYATHHIQPTGILAAFRF